MSLAPPPRPSTVHGRLCPVFCSLAPPQYTIGCVQFLGVYPLGDKSAAEKKVAEKRQEKAALKAIAAVKAVVAYCETAGCRRAALLGHFGEGKTANKLTYDPGLCETYFFMDCIHALFHKMFLDGLNVLFCAK